MKSSFSPLCLILVLVLFLAFSASLSASPLSTDSQSQPASQGYTVCLGFSFSGVSTNRTTVVRLAALGMFLALVIMYRSKH
jgi:hypothetical protein